VLIERALRDEGTNYHYLPPAEWSEASRELIDRLDHAFAADIRMLRGSTWTTDAPFRETPAAIDAMHQRGILAVEMEAAALYAFARASNRAVVCIAHVTNCMAQIEGDFEKGEANGAAEALRVVWHAAIRLGFA